jgi:hypothetical protein
LQAYGAFQFSRIQSCTYQDEVSTVRIPYARISGVLASLREEIVQSGRLRRRVNQLVRQVVSKP